MLLIVYFPLTSYCSSSFAIKVSQLKLSLIIMFWGNVDLIVLFATYLLQRHFPLRPIPICSVYGFTGVSSLHSCSSIRPDFAAYRRCHPANPPRTRLRTKHRHGSVASTFADCQDVCRVCRGVSRVSLSSLSRPRTRPPHFGSFVCVLCVFFLFIVVYFRRTKSSRDFSRRHTTFRFCKISISSVVYEHVSSGLRNYMHE